MASLSFTLPPPPLSHASLQPTTPFSSSSASSFLHKVGPTIPFSTLSQPKPTTNPHRRRRRLLPLAINLTSSNEDDPLEKIIPSRVLDHARNLLDSLPQPVKSFPWDKTLRSFLGLVLDLAVTVVKWLSVPVLAVSSLSEMSYCAHERKMRVIPIPFLIGFALAGVMKDTAVDLSEEFKEGGFPWHLLLIASFFMLLKLPGPYYPYWGRLVIPHFANGGLWRTVWFTFMWYRGSRSSAHADNSDDQQ